MESTSKSNPTSVSSTAINKSVMSDDGGSRINVAATAIQFNCNTKLTLGVRLGRGILVRSVISEDDAAAAGNGPEDILKYRMKTDGELLES